MLFHNPPDYPYMLSHKEPNSAARKAGCQPRLTHIFLQMAALGETQYLEVSAQNRCENAAKARMFEYQTFKTLVASRSLSTPVVLSALAAWGEVRKFSGELVSPAQLRVSYSANRGTRPTHMQTGAESSVFLHSVSRMLTTRPVPSRQEDKRALLLKSDHSQQKECLHKMAMQKYLGK